MQHLHQDDQVFGLVGGSGNKIVVIKFGATWCPPCVSLAPKLEQLASEYAGNPNVVFASVDVDECGGCSTEYGISGIPATKLF